MINTGREKMNVVNERVNDGEIERTNEYKYLGWWFNEKNNADGRVGEQARLHGKRSAKCWQLEQSGDM